MEIRLSGAELGLRFDAAHFIPGHEKCSRLHGHTYTVDLEVEGPIRDGMVLDFAKAKAVIREVIADLDHRVLVPRHLAEEVGGVIKVKHGTAEYLIPAAEVVLLPIAATSAELLAELLLGRVEELLAEAGIDRIRLGLHEGLGQGAWCATQPSSS